MKNKYMNNGNKTFCLIRRKTYKLSDNSRIFSGAFFKGVFRGYTHWSKLLLIHLKRSNMLIETFLSGLICVSLCLRKLPTNWKLMSSYLRFASPADVYRTWSFRVDVDTHARTLTLPHTRIRTHRHTRPSSQTHTNVYRRSSRSDWSSVNTHLPCDGAVPSRTPRNVEDHSPPWINECTFTSNCRSDVCQ